MLDVLIVIDNFFREGTSSFILKKKFNIEGHSCKIVSKSIFETAIIKLKPKIVIIPRINSGFEKVFDLAGHYNFKIFFIPCEHGGGDEDRIKSFIANYNFKDDLSKVNFGNLKKIDKIFVPSNKYKKTLLKLKFFTEDQILISGTLSTDLWFEEIKEKINKKFKKNKKTIGIATTFKSSFFGINFNTFHEGLYFMKKILDQRKFEEKINFDVSFLNYEIFCYLVILKIIEDNNNFNFSIRIHPQENIKNSLDLSKKIKNLTIDRSPILQEWLSNQSLIISTSSTVLYDAYYYDIPSISIMNLIPKYIIDKLEDVKKPQDISFCERPNNFEEIKKLINSTKRIEKKDNQLIENETLEKFNFPRKEFSFQIISREIKKYLEDDKKLNFFIKIKLLFNEIIINLKGYKAANLPNYKFIHADKLNNPLNFKRNREIKKILRYFF